MKEKTTHRLDGLKESQYVQYFMENRFYEFPWIRSLLHGFQGKNFNPRNTMDKPG